MRSRELKLKVKIMFRSAYVKTTVAVCNTCRQGICCGLEVSKDVVTLFRERYLVHCVTYETMLGREKQVGEGGRKRERGEGEEEGEGEREEGGRGRGR